MTPLIGVSTYSRAEKHVDSPAFEEHYATPALYVDAIRRAGGAAVLLPTGEGDITRWLSALDGVVVSGGADICPSQYGGDTAHPELGDVHPERDEAELALTRAVLAAQVPALFICRGMQLLNVALGGTLHEHIEDLGQGDIHRCPQEFWAKQSVDLEADSTLTQATGKARVVTMSGHHQGVKALGQGLRVLATADDGIVEAFEVTDHPFALGVQWHPEASATTDPAQQGVFDALVAAAQKKRPRRF